MTRNRQIGTNAVRAVPANPAVLASGAPGRTIKHLAVGKFAAAMAVPDLIRGCGAVDRERLCSAIRRWMSVAVGGTLPVGLELN
jgi:hypothetical protein